MALGRQTDAALGTVWLFGVAEQQDLGGWHLWLTFPASCCKRNDVAKRTTRPSGPYTKQPRRGSAQDRDPLVVA
jgi:hypothetical protein